MKTFTIITELLKLAVLSAILFFLVLSFNSQVDIKTEVTIGNNIQRNQLKQTKEIFYVNAAVKNGLMNKKIVIN